MATAKPGQLARSLISLTYRLARDSQYKDNSSHSRIQTRGGGRELYTSIIGVLKFGVLVFTLSILTACGSSSSFSGAGSASVTKENPDKSLEFDTEQDAAEISEAPTDSDAVRSPNMFTETFDGVNVVEARPMDVFFAMDTSGSMDTEKRFLEENMRKFVATLEAHPANIDFKVNMIGDNFGFGVTDVDLINERIGSHDSLEVLREVMSNNMTGLRLDSQKHIVIISDDNADGVLSSDFLGFLDASEFLKNQVKIHGLIGLPESQVNAWCEIEEVGTEYITLSQDKNYGGTMHDLCQDDWGDLLETLAADILQKTIRSQFELQFLPVSKDKIVVKVGDQVMESGWSYDEDANAITFDEGSAPPNGAEVQISYPKIKV